MLTNTVLRMARPRPGCWAHFRCPSQSSSESEFRNGCGSSATVPPSQISLAFLVGPGTRPEDRDGGTGECMTQLDDKGLCPQTSDQASPSRDASRRTTQRSRWADGYVRRLVVTDAIAVTIGCGAAFLLLFGSTDDEIAGVSGVNYAALTVLLAGGWLLSLTMVRSRHPRIVGSGPQEYVRVFKGSWRLFAVVAITAYLLKAGVGRGFLALAFPLGLTLALLGRYGWRQWLKRQRAEGRYESTLLVIGHRASAEDLVAELRARPEAGYVVRGVCVPPSETTSSPMVCGVPVLGGLDDAIDAATRLGVDAVAVTGSDHLTADVVRRLGWNLEPNGIDLVLAPALTDVAGPRIVVSPVNGLPLVHVAAPSFSGPKHVLKSIVDWFSAFVLTVLLAPLLIVVAVLVKLTSKGPIFFRQERVGLDHETFHIYKFRTMCADAESHLDEVLDGNVGLFYKRKDDPRITRVGRTLRRYSIDELPQLLNVMRGEMSLVGPRPQIDREVALYDQTAVRRLLVKPGLTGLWQVSGRSELTPEEGIRMDVFYVENWTLFGDFIILARTLRAILGKEGAY